MAARAMSEAPEPLAREVAAYTDAELNQYLEQNGRIVSVQDPENLSHELIQRLRTIVERAREATESHAVDLDEVVARLQAAPADTIRNGRSPSLATTDPGPPPEVQDQEDLQLEIKSYHALVDAGGRPPYPFHLLEDFFWNPDQFLEHEQHSGIVYFLRSKVYNKAERTCLCACQLAMWKNFRRLQCIIRERSVKDEHTLVAACLWDSWEIFVDRRGGMVGQWDFLEYEESLKRRLIKYGFTRPFQLDQDAARQDKLTTWIEYFGFEHWFYYQHTRFVERFQRRHDEAWEKLVAVLRPDETYDVICNTDSHFPRASEAKRAEHAAESASTAVSSLEKAISRSQVPSKTLHKRLLAARSALRAAKQTYDTVRARNNAIDDFLHFITRYRREKHEADRHRPLLQWIEQQIPSIELELNSTNGAKDDSTAARKHSGRLKRARSDSLEQSDDRQEDRRASVFSETVAARRTPTAAAPPSNNLRKLSRPKLADNGRPSKRLKMTGRSDAAKYVTVKASASGNSDTEAVQKSEGATASTSKPLPVAKTLRRSARIAEKQKKVAADRRELSSQHQR